MGYFTIGNDRIIVCPQNNAIRIVLTDSPRLPNMDFLLNYSTIRMWNDDVFTRQKRCGCEHETAERFIHL